MKGFIHIYECEQSLVDDFKEFANKHSCDRYNSALRYLLDFHKTFSSIVKEKEDLVKPKTFGGVIELKWMKKLKKY